MTNPCSKCGGPKPPGAGRRLCDDCRPVKGVCSKCGSPKPKGNGRRVCDDCQVMRVPKPCRRCGKERQWGDSGPGNVYCRACQPVIAAKYQPKMCVSCGDPKGKGRTFYCDDCGDAAAWKTARRRAARLKMKTKRCVGCNGVKDMGRWYRYCSRCVREREQRRPTCNTPGCTHPTDGPRKRICSECREAAHQRQLQRLARRRERIRNDPALLVAQRQQRLAGYYRLRQDPERWAAYLEATRLSSALRREREGATLHEMRPPTSSTKSHGQTVPGLPLVQAVDAQGYVRGDFAGLAGFAEKRLNEWSRGGRTHVLTADKALVILGVCWFDVWTPENTEPEELGRIAVLFEGEEARAA